MVQRLKKLSLYLFLGLLAYMPLHVFLSIWLGTSFDILPAAKVLKDVLLVSGFGLALAASHNQKWFKELLKDKLVWLITAYVLLTIGLAAVKPTDTDAEILGVVYNLRFLVFFAYAALIARLFDAKRARELALGWTIAVATVVLFFGVVQYTILPNDALNHVGYERANGVLPVFLIDEKPDLERVMSTLRDPNSLGSYIIIIACLAWVFLLRKRLPKQITGGLLALSALCLVFTFSRSAWLGMIAALAVATVLCFRKHLAGVTAKRIGLAAGVILVTVAAGLYAGRNTYLVKNVVLHADESTVLEDPNQLRTKFWRQSVEGIIDDPVGSGPGTAGLASIHNQVQGTELNENYYLQIASEVGLVGLVLFLSILGVVGYRLLQASVKDPLALALFASFVGLGLTNFLVHIWSTEAVACVWWGLAGLVVVSRPRTRR